MKTKSQTQSEQEAQPTKQQGVKQGDPSKILDISAQTDNAYNISVLTSSQSSMGSEVYPQTTEVYYRIQSDKPSLLLKADNLVSCIEREFNISHLDRYEGESYEIIIEPTTIPNGVSTIKKEGSSELSCTVVENDSISLLYVVKEFISEANSQL